MVSDGGTEASAAEVKPWLKRMGRYVGATMAACLLAAFIGETFFPAVLIGDTGENDFAGLAALFWAFCAFVICALLAVVCEIALSLRRHRQ